MGECNYVTHGNYDALGNTYLYKKLMQHIGLNPQRLQIQFMSGADGGLLAEACDAFSKEMKQLGPIGKAEGIDSQTLKFKLEAAMKLIPYIRLVEREKLRLPSKSKEAYERFFTSAKFEQLFNASILGNLAISQIMLLLSDGPLSTGQISERLGLSPSEVSRHMNLSSRHGFVRYDVNSKCYALA